MAFWDNRVKSLSKSFKASKDIFLANKDISRVMQTHNVGAIDKLINYLNDPDIVAKIKDPRFGSPNTHKGLTLQSARNAVYRKIMANYFDLSNINHVTDFGGGYGNNCRVWNNLGFQGHFALVDLPEVIEIQKHYISNVIPAASVSYASILSDVKIEQPQALFFATYSLSETSLEIREKAIDNIKEYDYIFIAHNDTFPVYGQNNSVNNNNYFDKMKKDFSDQFEFFDFTDKIYKKNASYVIGRKK